MTSVREKVPIITRLASHLERHGLSFGDALNIALFVLTIVSLYLAYQAVRIAKETLEDARTQAAQAANDQRVQFQEQMGQLRTSSDAMQKTGSMLKSQGDILRDLQRVSRQQLKDLNAAEARIEKQENARPAPKITGSCGALLFLETSERDFKLDPITRAGRVYTNSATLHPGQNGELQCGVRLSNEGAAALRNVTLEAQVWCPGHALITYINGIENGNNAGELMAGLNVPPKSISNRPFSTAFTVRYGTCTKFQIVLVLEADNLDTLQAMTEVTLH